MAILSDPGFNVNPFMKVWREHKENTRKWVEQLRARGVAGAMPDDGWVDRERNRLQFVYPYFLDSTEAGSLIALGDHARYRIVKITGRIVTMLGRHVYIFERED